MKNLVIFGCEYSNNDYLKLNFKDSWVEYFSEYNYFGNIENHSIINASNDLIYDYVLKYIGNNIYNDKYFLIGWADVFRKEYEIEGKKYIITDDIDLNKEALSAIDDSDKLLYYFDKYGFLTKNTFLMNTYNSILGIQSLLESLKIPYLFFNSKSNLNQKNLIGLLRYRNLIDRRRYLKFSFQEFVESISDKNTDNHRNWTDYIIQKIKDLENIVGK